MSDPIIFDGHNDTLLKILDPEEPYDFFAKNAVNHIDLPRAKEGGLGGGFFAVFVPPPPQQRKAAQEWREKNPDAFPPLADAIEANYARDTAMMMAARFFKLERESGGAFTIVRDVDTLATCLRDGTMAGILHFEGAEPIDEDLNALEVFYQAGLRSLGIVWSRPNAFAEGVPFKYPHSPDTGPGLTDAGKALVKACNELGIMLDMSHINEKGFWDVAQLSDAPLVATHSNVHAIAPLTRNLTDKQLDAIKETGGVVGLNFGVIFLRDDGKRTTDVPLEMMVRHIDYMVARMGIDHVALGSDFDGTRIPDDIGDAAGLPKLMRALRDAGYDDEALRKIAHENWLRVLRLTWK